MTTMNEHTIKTLNSLVEVTLDSAHGYREAAKEAKNPRFKSLFEQRSVERESLTVELQEAVRDLGGTPEEEGTVLASAHRMFLNLKNTVTGSDQSIVDEVEAGEDHIKAKFEDALSDDELLPTSKDTVGSAFTVIKAGHDQMRDIKHALEAQSHN